MKIKSLFVGLVASLGVSLASADVAGTNFRDSLVSNYTRQLNVTEMYLYQFQDYSYYPLGRYEALQEVLDALNSLNNPTIIQVTNLAIPFKRIADQAEVYEWNLIGTNGEFYYRGRSEIYYSVVDELRIRAITNKRSMKRR